MAERPILFSDEMVRAILDGRKSQTRRVVKPAPRFGMGVDRLEYGRHPFSPSAFVGTPAEGCVTGEDRMAWLAIDGYENVIGAVESTEMRCPYGVPGDLLWVRETFYCDVDHGPDDYPWIYYKADGAAHQHDGRSISGRAGFVPDRDGPWKPSIHMPRSASRILLRVTDVRVERVQDISEEDARAEGVKQCGGFMSTLGCWTNYGADGPSFDTARESFASLWDSINAARGLGWDANPWVWVVSFEVAEVKR